MRQRLPADFSGFKPVGIWIRVSTNGQAKGDSPAHQEHQARFYADLKDWEVKEVYRLDAVSGKSVLQHPEAQRMLQDIKRGRITGLICSKLARLARNTRELLAFADLFQHYKADLICLHESIDTTMPAGRLMYTLIAALAEWEREEIAQRVAVSIPLRAKQGKHIGGVAPFGYQWINGQLVPDPKEAPILRSVFELFIEHRRKMAVARCLNDAGHRTRRGKKFTDVTIRQLLQNSTAKGLHRSHYTTRTGNKKSWVFKPQEQWIYARVEPVVSEELWYRCQAILQQQKGSTPLFRSEEKNSGKDLLVQEETGSLSGSEMKQNGHCHFKGSVTFGRCPRYTLVLARPIVPPKGYPVAPRTLGEHVRKRRMDLGLLQAQVAERIGVTASTVWNWEHGTKPGAQYLAKIVQFLGYKP